ncbi:hypothetical protein [Pseudobacteriovorax antillogorgiicola]|uniref:Uncharacterized protein n=1 Tax=Pseudobacteriovorax antillogorgiicola TaxID=1513793 RepID=A0A1Y6CIR0_9BACT|nr:hypothetical protein [Pseudobacteriovorax antillogorgiicola]TCS47025.1 hypothetical protein EDD56_122120 [Pseudobacteriovorax antillogorgiicola]SMF65238.1 hypothetical protein SAMN06296036_122120 [Pseudobacteriovorax antillogorgiicola]
MSRLTLFSVFLAMPLLAISSSLLASSSLFPIQSRFPLIFASSSWRLSAESVEGVYQEEEVQDSGASIGEFRAVADGGIIDFASYSSINFLRLGFGMTREVLQADNETTVFFGDREVVSEVYTRRELYALSPYVGIRWGAFLYGLETSLFWGKRRVDFGLGIDADSEVKFHELRHELYLLLGDFVLSLQYQQGVRAVEEYYRILRHGSYEASLVYQLNDLRLGLEYRNILTNQFDDGSTIGHEIQVSWEGRLTDGIILGMALKNRPRHYKQESDIYLDNMHRFRWMVYADLEEDGGHVGLGLSQAIYSFDGRTLDISYQPIYLNITFRSPLEHEML